MIHFYSVASGLCGLSVLLFIPCSLHSQEHRLKLSSLSPTPLEYLKLLEPNSEIRDNIILNESIVDLADVYLTDSILPRKFERHQLALVGGFTRLVGRRWLTINWRKEKYVGTAKNGFRIP
ncbi:MAG TPA: hypothetical protein VNJ07_03680, partial [Chitinophagales bacterium]|nr:hypothetical protein [Chitinophagales bacterium]